jgi:hypothetical protein
MNVFTWSDSEKHLGLACDVLRMPHTGTAFKLMPVSDVVDDEDASVALGADSTKTSFLDDVGGEDESAESPELWRSLSVDSATTSGSGALTIFPGAEMVRYWINRISVNENVPESKPF